MPYMQGVSVCVFTAENPARVVDHRVGLAGHMSRAFALRLKSAQQGGTWTWRRGPHSHVCARPGATAFRQGHLCWLDTGVSAGLHMSSVLHFS